MARYNIKDFKYLYNDKEITSEEYVNYLIDDADYYGTKIGKTTAKKIMAEDHMTAYERGSQEFYLSGGGVLSIVRNI
jgi:hypothetical protein